MVGSAISKHHREIIGSVIFQGALILCGLTHVQASDVACHKPSSSDMAADADGIDENDVKLYNNVTKDTKLVNSIMTRSCNHDVNP